VRTPTVIRLLSQTYARWVPLGCVALSAHVGTIINGMFIALIGVVWDQLTLSSRWSATLFWSTVYSGFANWAGLFLAAVFGTRHNAATRRGIRWCALAGSGGCAPADEWRRARPWCLCPGPHRAASDRTPAFMKNVEVVRRQGTGHG
jgi:hypothetical protein